MSNSMEEAAKRLKVFVFGEDHPLPSPGFVGVGSEDLYVYIHAQKAYWLGKVVREWEGYHVITTFNVGRPIP